MMGFVSSLRPGSRRAFASLLPYIFFSITDIVDNELEINVLCYLLSAL